MSASLLPRAIGWNQGAPALGCVGWSSTLEALDGQSPESEIILSAHERIAEHFCRPISRLRSDPVRRFYELLWTWSQEVKTLSDIDAICTHPAYQQIIGMGETALPLIFREVQRGEDYWFWALKAITGDDPVPEEDRGRITVMKRHWVRWANEHGYA